MTGVMACSEPAGRSQLPELVGRRSDPAQHGGSASTIVLLRNTAQVPLLAAPFLAGLGLAPQANCFRGLLKLHSTSELCMGGRLFGPLNENKRGGGEVA